MLPFDTPPTSDEYPAKLREIRRELGYSQHSFAEAGGYSAVMQGRYETDRRKSNSAIPSERTARAIRQVIEKSTVAHSSKAQTERTNLIIDSPPVQQRTLKSVATAEIEQAISTAIAALIGSRCKVTMNSVNWTSSDTANANISFNVDSPETST